MHKNINTSTYLIQIVKALFMFALENEYFYKTLIKILTIRSVNSILSIEFTDFLCFQMDEFATMCAPGKPWEKQTIRRALSHTI